MSARTAIVSQSEIKRTLQAALSVGLRIGRVEVDHATGRVVVFPEGTAPQAAGPDPDDLLK
ncbi:hypothetical protein [Rhodovulum sulfidophilum]|uniref:hypothetical protein n=1 Tax=Rhodovulum sulfidophilum TaxID=35806 RepID=UPI0009516685|nr:hypothetical protein [Rhodovulum sulfidophilum]MBL3563022.1 hypothetical protein [Rhodovulum sulfidophilum]OLS51887.1 hypothetical protein BV392_07625 [Rhodovulum sulfidophilum]